VLLAGCATKVVRPVAAKPPMPPVSSYARQTVNTAQAQMPKKVYALVWDYADTDLPYVKFEVVHKQQMSAPWQLYAVAVHTNLVVLTNDYTHNEFFTISRVISTLDTNVFITQKGF
jgi:hypothetical protein